MTSSPKTCFVSDLHVFSSRSQEHRYLEELRAAAADAKRFVLGGDIFDFRWSTVTSHEETVVRAIQWLRQLAADCPACHFHFVLGNHDTSELFIERLDHLVRRVDNLSWYPFYVRLGTAVFLHGDVADRRMTAQKLADRRADGLGKHPRGRLANRLYDLAVYGRLHKPIVHLARRKRTVARRILRYLDEIGEGPATGLRGVYFGHTHLALADYRYRGILFHNGGAPIKGLHFRIIEAVT